MARACPSPPERSARRGEADRRSHRARIGNVLTGNIERGAMIWRGADYGQSQSDVDAFFEMQRLEWDQGLVVVHAQRGVVARPRSAVKHGIGGQWPDYLPTLGTERVDCGLDDVDILAAERATLARMGIERGDREARFGDPEIALQPAQRHPAARFDHRAAEQAGNLGERHVGRDRDGTKRRPGEHHRDIGGRNAAPFGDEFGLAGVGEPDRIKLLFRYRAGDHRAGRTRAGKPDRKFERIE